MQKREYEETEKSTKKSVSSPKSQREYEGDLSPNSFPRNWRCSQVPGQFLAMRLRWENESFATNPNNKRTKTHLFAVHKATRRARQTPSDRLLTNVNLLALPCGMRGEDVVQLSARLFVRYSLWKSIVPAAHEILLRIEHNCCQ